MRPKLIGLAYRLLGSYSEAEDAVQDASLKWHQADGGTIDNPEAWLSRVTTNLCLDRLKRRQTEMEAYRGRWLPEPVGTPTPQEAIEAADQVSFAFLVLLEQLKAKERAAYLLHDVFAYDYGFIAETLELSEANCRQIVKRARDRLKENRPRFEASPNRQHELRDGFIDAHRTGDFAAFLALLTDDVVLESDGGFSVKSAPNRIAGLENVAAFIAGIRRKTPIEPRMEPCTINGMPGLLTYDGEKLFSATAFECSVGGIERIYVVLNQDKLTRLSVE